MDTQEENFLIFSKDRLLSENQKGTSFIGFLIKQWPQWWKNALWEHFLFKRSPISEVSKTGVSLFEMNPFPLTAIPDQSYSSPRCGGDPKTLKGHFHLSSIKSWTEETSSLLMWFIQINLIALRKLHCILSILSVIVLISVSKLKTNSELSCYPPHLDIRKQENNW